MDATLPMNIQNIMDKVESKKNVLVKRFMVKGVGVYGCGYRRIQDGWVGQDGGMGGGG